MASCSSAQWVSTSPYIKLIVTINESNSDGDTAYLNWELQYIASSAANTSVPKAYYVQIDGTNVKSGTYDIDGKTGTNIISSGFKEISKGTSSKSVSFGCSMNIEITWSDNYKGTISASSLITIPAKTSYTVTYNANGGSGTPPADTKWYGTALNLNFSTIPTRTGYTFLGYSTSSTATSATWNSSSKSYTYNSGATLYAVWSENSITIYYCGNGADYGTYQGETVDLNDVVHTDVFLYDNLYTTGLSNVQNKEYLYLSRTGYIPTGYWGVGDIRIHEDDTTLNTGEKIAQAFNMTLANESQGVRVYAQWKRSGLVHIDNGNNFEQYNIYIDSGKGWDLYVPYIDNGTSWDLLS